MARFTRLSLALAPALIACSAATTTVVHRDGSTFEAVVERADAETVTLSVPATRRVVVLRRGDVARTDLPGDAWAGVGATMAVVGLGVMSEGLLSERDAARVVGYGTVAVIGTLLTAWGLYQFRQARAAWATPAVDGGAGGLTVRF